MIHPKPGKTLRIHYKKSGKSGEVKDMTKDEVLRTDKGKETKAGRASRLKAKRKRR